MEKKVLSRGEELIDKRLYQGGKVTRDYHREDRFLARGKKRGVESTPALGIGFPNIRELR